MTFNYGDQVFCERGKILELARNAGLHIVLSEAMLEGYQIYLVEQWCVCVGPGGGKTFLEIYLHFVIVYRVCNRNRPYKTIKVFTGDPSHQVGASKCFSRSRDCAK